MSQYKDAAIGDIVYFWFAANLITGAAGDGATPLYSVRLAGAAASAAPKATGTPTLLTNVGYTDGLYEVVFDTTGWEAGEYAVFCTLTISTVNPAGFCGSVMLRVAGSSIYQQIAKVIAGVTLANGPHGGAGATIVLQTPIEANVASETNHDFTALQKTSLNAATPNVPTESEIADQVWNEALSGHATAGSAGEKLTNAGAGSGLVAKDYTATDSMTGLPLADVLVWVTTDIAGANMIASKRTNALGIAKLWPDVPVGTTLYIWRAKTGYDFTNPDVEVF